MQTYSDVRWWTRVALALAMVADLDGASVCAQVAPFNVRPDAHGNIHIPSFVLPPSPVSSDEAVRAMIANGHRLLPAIPTSIVPGPELDRYRAEIDRILMIPTAKAAMAHYPVTITAARIGGVKVNIIKPRDGVAAPNRNRVLINLHGGGFFAGGGGWGGIVESIPIVGVGKFEVISIDYRQGPEFKHPAATDDVAAVYGELLKSFPPQNIGIYGCSAGGALSAMSTVAILQKRLPRPGAIGIYGSGVTIINGDSTTISSAIAGISLPPPARAESKLPLMRSTPYFSDADPNDPIVNAAAHPDVLAKFPPTQIISSVRAPDLSSAVATDVAMTKVGVDSELHVWDGLGHCFLYDSGLPESQDAYNIITSFFNQHLGQ